MKQAMKWVATITFLILSVVGMPAGHAQAGVSGKSYNVTVHVNSESETSQFCFIFAEDGTFWQPGDEDSDALSGQWTQQGLKFEVEAHKVDYPDDVFVLRGISPNNFLLGNGKETYGATFTFFGRASSCAGATYNIEPRNSYAGEE